MKLIEFTGHNGGKISIVISQIQGITEASGDRKGKANIIVARLSEEVDDYFAVEETYREAQMMLNEIFYNDLS